jgi:hypothetical protein
MIRTIISLVRRLLRLRPRYRFVERTGGRALVTSDYITKREIARLKDDWANKRYANYGIPAEIIAKFEE